MHTMKINENLKKNSSNLIMLLKRLKEGNLIILFITKKYLNKLIDTWSL